MNNDDDGQCRNVFLCIQKTQKKLMTDFDDNA